MAKKPIVVVTRLPSFYEDAASRVEHSLDEEYDDGGLVHETPSHYRVWGVDPAELYEALEGNPSLENLFDI